MQQNAFLSDLIHISGSKTICWYLVDGCLIFGETHGIVAIFELTNTTRSFALFTFMRSIMQFKWSRRSKSHEGSRLSYRYIVLLLGLSFWRRMGESLFNCLPPSFLRLTWWLHQTTLRIDRHEAHNLESQLILVVCVWKLFCAFPTITSRPW